MSRSLSHLAPQGGAEAASSLVDRLAGRIHQGWPLPPVSGGAPGDPDPDPATPTPTPTVPTPTTPTTPTPTPTPGDPAEGFRKLLEKHQNDTAIVAGKLYDENHTHRETIRTLKAKVPGEGSLVLTPDQAKAWTAYTALGAPEAVAQIKAEHGQFATERQQAAKEKLHGAAAAAHGYKPAVLTRLADQDKLELTLVTSKDVAGKDVTVARVKDGDKDATLPEYAQAHWGEFLPALAATPEVRPVGTPRAGGAPPPATPPETPRRSFVR